jgi:hypothetical protein
MRASFLLASLALTACGPSVEEFVAASRDAALAKLALVDKVAPLARAERTDDGDTMTNPGPLSLCDLMVPPHREAPCDTFAVSIEQLESPRRYFSPRPVIEYGPTEWLVLTRSLIETGLYPPTEEYPDGVAPERLSLTIEHAFRWLKNLRYLLVVVPQTFVPPTVAADQSNYAGGVLEAVAILYVLEPSPRSLGTVHFGFSMSGDIKIKMKRGVINAREIQDAFAKVVRGELVKALKTRLPELEPEP